MKQFLTKGLMLLALGLTPVAAYASPVQVGIGSFSGSETVLTFDGIGLGQIVTTNFLPQGVDFSNSTHVSGSTAAGASTDVYPFFTSPGTAVLQNFLGGTGNCFGVCPAIVIDFSVSQPLIGMDILTNFGLSTFTVENTILGTSSVFNINTHFPESFVGFSDPSGINRITISGPEDNGAIGLNDLRYLNTPSAVPEPGTMLLLGSGLVGLIGYRMKKARG